MGEYDEFSPKMQRLLGRATDVKVKLTVFERSTLAEIAELAAMFCQSFGHDEEGVTTCDAHIFLALVGAINPGWREENDEEAFELSRAKEPVVVKLDGGLIPNNTPEDDAELRMLEYIDHMVSSSHFGTGTPLLEHRLGTSCKTLAFFTLDKALCPTREQAIHFVKFQLTALVEGSPSHGIEPKVPNTFSTEVHTAICTALQEAFILRGWEPYSLDDSGLDTIMDE